MTIQVAICAADGSIVLAGDTKVRTSESAFSASDQISTPTYRSKIVLGSRHNIAVAMAGHEPAGKDATADLAEHLSREEKLPDDLGPVLESWGNRHFNDTYPDESDNWPFPPCTMLVIRPDTEFVKLYKLHVNFRSAVEPLGGYRVNGQCQNSAVFWLEYMEAGSPLLSLEGATSAAIMTVLMASKIDPYAIGGLEVHQYTGGKWSSWSFADCTAAQLAFARAHSAIREIAAGSGRLHSTTPA